MLRSPPTTAPTPGQFEGAVVPVVAATDDSRTILAQHVERCYWARMARKQRQKEKPGVEGAWVAKRNPYDGIVAIGDKVLSDQDREGLWDEEVARTRARYPALAVAEEALDTKPIVAQDGIPKPDQVRQDLVSPRGRLPVSDLLDATIDLLSVVREGVLGVGAGGLFNFERSFLDDFVALAARARARRVEAECVARWFRATDELAAVYATTTRNWPTDETKTSTTPRLRRKVLADQERELTVILKRYGIPCTDANLRKCRLEGSDIKALGYAVKAAQKVLQSLRRGSASKLAKERQAMSPAFLARIDSPGFTLNPSDEWREKTAEEVGDFARALYMGATGRIQPRVSRRLADPEEARREMIDEGKRRLVLLHQTRGLPTTPSGGQLEEVDIDAPKDGAAGQEPTPSPQTPTRGSAKP